MFLGLYEKILQEKKVYMSNEKVQHYVRWVKCKECKVNFIRDLRIRKVDSTLFLHSLEKYVLQCEMISTTW